MMSDEAFKASLSARGVPRSVWSIRVGEYPDLHELIKNRQYQLPGGLFNSYGMYVTAKGRQQVTRDRFYLLAKGLVLQGVDAHCYSLERLLEICAPDTTDEYLLSLRETVADAQYLFVSDFYEPGIGAPERPHVMSHVRGILRQRLDDRRGVAILCSVERELEELANWWGQSFTHQLIDSLSFQLQLDESKPRPEGR